MSFVLPQFYAIEMIHKLFENIRFGEIITWFFRTFFPVFRFRDWVVVSRYSEVIEVLSRNQDFTISEINAARMHAVDIDFFLGMDTSPQHDREKGIMELVAKREDMGRIQQFVSKESERITDEIKTIGKIEVVETISRIVPVLLVDNYFGVRNPNQKQMLYWLRILFHQLFLNLNNDPVIEAKAKKAGNELKPFLNVLISDRRRQMEEGKECPDDLITRLLKLQPQYDWLDTDAIRRNISGLIIGAVETTSKCVVLVLEELFRRPEVLKEAIALANKNDIKALKNYCYEALRFNPHNPIVIRYASEEQRIGKNGKYKIPAQCKVLVGIYSGMFDKKVFTSPGKFKVDRKTEYLHFGYGMHECFGKHINAVQIPIIVAATLRLPNLRKSSINDGKVINDGPFPESFWLEFD